MKFNSEIYQLSAFQGPEIQIADKFRLN